MTDKTPEGGMLEDKQELFAQEMARGATASGAYRKAYDADGMQASSIHVEASRLRNNPKVSLRIDELKAAAADVAIVDASMVLRGLLSEAESIDEGSSQSARVAAWAHLGKHLGMFTDKIEHTGKNGQPIQQEVVTLTPEQVIERMSEKRNDY